MLVSVNRQPRVLFVTTPVRPVPTCYPPIAVLTIMKSLRQKGFDDVNFYNIDLLRPSIKEAIDHVIEFQPDILAISAVVSTAYAYVKELTLGVKSVTSDMAIIVGGPLGASAELVLSETGVDLVCISEGEPVMSDLLTTFTWPMDLKLLREVKGLVFFDDKRNLISTGYAKTVDKSDLYDLDLENLRELESFNQYFPKVLADDGIFGDDPRIHCDGLYGGRSFEVPGSKGCVAKCTFCHRWDKGIRYIPVPIIVARLKTLIADFGVRFIRMADENFGTDKRWLTEFCLEMKDIGMPWAVSGMRVNCIDEQTIQMMKDAGCVTCLFGMETGSARMLKVMNKGVEIEDNYNALKLIYANGLKTTIQLVIGMPGETDDTIQETAEFLRFAGSLSEEKSPFETSINYAQALPGTPLYEYARHIGLIGKSIEEEESYLLWISDKNAGDDDFALPELTGLSRLKVFSWRPFLVANVNDAYIESYGWRAYCEHLRRHFLSTESSKATTGYFTIPKERDELGTVKRSFSVLRCISLFFQHPIYLFPKPFVHSRLALYSFTLARHVYKHGVKNGFALLVEHVDMTWLSKKKIQSTKYPFAYESLRSSMKEVTNNYSEENEVMKSLRAGRW